ncbi:hypothetical protein N665_0048s0028 [Sinapis alba]|nr:hypothetical protein N665_0048s0028 [Sinapis alba]
MNTQRTAPPNQHAHNDEDSEDDENIFVALRHDQALRHTNDSDSEEDDSDTRWKSSFKLEFPEFSGSTVPEELLDWFVTVEEILEFKEIPLNHCVPLIVIRFRDRAAAWWSKSKATCARLGKTKIATWDKLNKHRVKNRDCRRTGLHIQSTTTERPALLFLWRTHRQSACPTRNRRGLLIEDVTLTNDPIYDEEQDKPEEDLYPDTGHLLVVRRSCLAPRADVQFPQRNKLFQSRCTINGKVFSFVIDSGSCENVIAADAVTKLEIKDEPHPCTYKLDWLQKMHDLFITRRALVTCSVGNSYKDKIYCEIVPMDVCHLLLGRPWEFDRRVIHDGLHNT